MRFIAALFRDVRVKISWIPLASLATDGTIAGMNVAPIAPSAPISAPSATNSPSPTASATQNPYQQALDSLTSWEYQYLYQSLNSTPSTLGEYATAGLSVDQFAALATKLQALSASGSTGNIVDTSA
jgi:hypothetical protein